MDGEPETPARGGAFPATRRSVVARTRSEDPAIPTQAFEILIGAYRKPVHKYLRLKWHASDEDARDLTQEFFARAMEKGLFDGYDPARARFRTFLRTCLDGFGANGRKAEQRLKRGGGITLVPLFRRLLLARLRDLCPTEDEFRREARHLFGVEPR